MPESIKPANTNATYNLIRLIPQPNESGDPSTLGTRWSWQVISWPSQSIVDFGPPPCETSDDAIKDAKAAYPHLDFE